MTETELGLTVTIKSDEHGKYVVVRDDGVDIKVYLEDQPIASRGAIFSRGTACFRGRLQDSSDWEFVVKFSCQSEERESERSLLQLAKEKDVEYVAEWV